MISDGKAGRDAILGKVRKGLGASVETPGRRAAVEQRLAAHERHLIPARVAGKEGPELVAILRRWLEAAAGELIEAPSMADVPRLVAQLLRQHNLPARLRTGGDSYLASLPWASEPTIEVQHGRAEPGDAVGLTHALAAIAETGTLVVPSGAANPRPRPICGCAVISSAITRRRTDRGAWSPRRLCGSTAGCSRESAAGGARCWR